jgi:hypothetical protein
MPISTLLDFTFFNAELNYTKAHEICADAYA